MPSFILPDWMAHEECRYYCSRRNKCKPRYCISYSQEMPLREPPHRHRDQGRSFNNPPPDPPPGDGEWDLQYCSWSGWTWVKKGDVSTEMSRPPPRPKPNSDSEKKKNNGGGFWCFKKKSKSPESSLPATKSSQSSQKRSEHDDRGMRGSEDFDCCCCCMNQCCCHQVCCPCMTQTCCCCMDSQPQPQETCCKDCQTQTVKEVKEQATKMSEMCVPKKMSAGGKKRCMCRCRRVCCPCRRNTCCPCIQPTCCPCKNVQTASGCQTDSKSPCLDKIVNYCLQSNIPRKKNDLLNYKATSFSTLHKSLDLLLKNNINIMNLFDDKKEVRNDFKPLSTYTSNQTITCLSSDHLKKTDPDHSKLLTAVCDAILSSHKFDDFSSRPLKQCEVKDSGHCFNVYSSRNFLEKILSEMNFTKTNKSNANFNPRKENGVPQIENSSKQVETCQPKRSLTRLVRNRSRILKNARFPRKVESLRKSIEKLKIGSQDIKSSRRNIFENRIGKVSEKRVNTGEENKLSLTEIFKSSNEETAINKLKMSFDYSTQKAPKEGSSAIDNIESLLNSIDYMNGSTSCKEPVEKRPDVFSQNRKSIHLLDSTSPPFIDTDLLHNLSDIRLENDGNE